jgi:dTMP kinase
MGHQAGKIHNIAEREEFLDWLNHLEYEIFKIPRPNFNLFLYVDPETSRNLALNVEKQNMDKSKDVHENDAQHMKDASNAFKYVADKYKRKTIYCLNENTLRTREDIAEEVISYVLQQIK